MHVNYDAVTVVLLPFNRPDIYLFFFLLCIGKLQFSMQALRALERLKFRCIALAWCMLWVTSGFLFYQGQRTHMSLRWAAKKLLLLTQ